MRNDQQGAVDALKYTSVSMLRRKVEYTMKDNDLYLQIHPRRNIKDIEMAKEEKSGKGPTWKIINALEGVIPKSLKLKVLPPKKYIQQYTVVVKDFGDLFGDPERLIGKIIEALKKMPPL